MIIYCPYNGFKLSCVKYVFVDCGGVLSPAETHQYIWNRTGSLRGGPGSNLGIDLINELLNNDFKGLQSYLKHSIVRQVDHTMN